MRTAYEPSAQLHRTGLRLTWSLGHEATRSTGTLLDGCQNNPFSFSSCCVNTVYFRSSKTDEYLNVGYKRTERNKPEGAFHVIKQSQIQGRKS